MNIKRIVLFLLGCMGTRFSYTFLAKTQPQYLTPMGYLALVPAIGFMVIYLTGMRQTGPEVFGGKLWWNSLRPIHSLLWATFAFLAIRGNKHAWLVLLVDTLLGLLFWSIHQFQLSKGIDTELKLLN